MDGIVSHSSNILRTLKIMRILALTLMVRGEWPLYRQDMMKIQRFSTLNLITLENRHDEKSFNISI